MSVNNFSSILDDNNNLDTKKVDLYLRNHTFPFPEKHKDVSDTLKSEVENILWVNTWISNLILLMYTYNILHIDNSAIENFTREKELKIYNVNRDELIDKIQNHSFKEKTYSAVINDDYYEFHDLRLKNWIWNWWIKSSLRTRKKELISVNWNSFEWQNPVKNYCTLKKEFPNNNSNRLKDVYEFELDLNHPDHFNYLIRALWMEHYKSKVKSRVSFLINKELTIDIDTYNIERNNLILLPDDKIMKIINSSENFKDKSEKDKKDELKRIKELIEVVVVEMEVPKEEILDSALNFAWLIDNEKYPKSTNWFWWMFKETAWRKVQKFINEKDTNIND